MKTITHQRTVGDLIAEWGMKPEVTDEQDNRLLTIRDACRLTNLHPSSLYRLIASDKNLRVYDLHAGRTGKPCYRIRMSDLEDWLAGRRR